VCVYVCVCVCMCVCVGSVRECVCECVESEVGDGVFFIVKNIVLLSDALYSTRATKTVSSQPKETEN